MKVFAGTWLAAAISVKDARTQLKDREERRRR